MGVAILIGKKCFEFFSFYTHLNFWTTNDEQYINLYFLTTNNLRGTRKIVPAFSEHNR